jgi:Fe-S cluster assembly protein SufD
MMNVAVAKTSSSQPLDELFAVARDRLPGLGKVADARQNAFDDFTRRGLPHRRIEEWKYTDLRALLREVAPLAPAPDQAAFARAAKAVKALSVEGTQKFVLVDGVFAPQLSDLGALEKAIQLRTLREILEDAGNDTRADLLQTRVASDAMISLNAALATDGVVIDVADGASPTKPIHVVHVATAAGASAVTRSLVKIGRDAHVTLIESFIAADGAKSYQAHDSIVIWIGDNTQLQHVRLMEDARDAANISTAIFTVGAKATLNTFNLTNGGQVSRYQAFIAVAGEHSRVETNGVNLLNGTQHADTTLFMDHAVPHCASREVFRAVLDDRAHSVFQGRIIVQPDAQKTDAKMMTRALLLSDDAEADNKPELEIFADDVTCGHGATTGALDESLLFYLRARGLTEKQAQALLITAFVGEAIESIADDNVRDVAIAAAERWLAARG